MIAPEEFAEAYDGVRAMLGLGPYDPFPPSAYE